MMKKYLAFLAAMILVLGLAACGSGKAPETTVPTTVPPTTVEPTTVPTTVPTEPAPSAVIGGMELIDMTLEEAAAALNEATASYRLSLTVNGKELSLSAEEMGMALDEAALAGFLAAAAEGSELPGSVFTYDRTALKSLLGKGLNTAATNATVSFDKTKKEFVAKEGEYGALHDLEAAADAAAEALGMLIAAAQVEVTATPITPDMGADSEAVQKALAKANGYLANTLTYTFTPDGCETARETVGPVTMSGFITVSESMEVKVSKSVIESWAADMAEKHRGPSTSGKFVTTAGSTVSLTVTYDGQKVNKSSLADDLYKSITEGRSGERKAPYYAKSKKPYGGSYVEIDLSSQKLWLYIGGEQIVSTKLVSGSVAEGHRTPTGVYSIYSKQRDRYLTGADYRSFVNYWMPFLGGYGLHDASWRSSFGGDIYLYNGSHGCVNLPSSAAKKIYENVSVGTRVILYGGKTEVPDLEQKLTGTTSYTVNADAGSFKLDVKAKYKGAEITYSSSDTSVVTVSSSGTVTVKGVGTAVITVKAAAFEFYTGAELKITVTVNEAPKPTEPTPTEPKPTEPAPTEPAPTEPEPTEPAPTEPKPTEPAPTEPKPTEPAPTEPAPTEPAPTETEPAE